MTHPIEPKYWLFVKGYEDFHFTKNIGKNLSEKDNPNILDHSKYIRWT